MSTCRSNKQASSVVSTVIASEQTKKQKTGFARMIFFFFSFFLTFEIELMSVTHQKAREMRIYQISWDRRKCFRVLTLHSSLGGMKGGIMREEL